MRYTGPGKNTPMHRFILFALIFWSTLVEGRASLDPRTIVQYAREYRTDPLASATAEDLRKQKLLEQVYANLISYDSAGSLPSALRDFVADFVVENADDLFITDSTTSNLRGHSSDSVYFVTHKSGELRYVIKAFRNPRQLTNKFLPEISGLDLLIELDLPHVGHAEPLAVATFCEPGAEWALLLQAAIPGHRMDHILTLLSDRDLSEEERQKHLEAAEKAFYRMGSALKALHSIKSADSTHIPEQTVNHFDQKLKAVLDNRIITDQLSQAFSLQDFAAHVDQVKQKALKVRVFSSYCHGDANLGNMLYDERSDTLYFIDLDKLHASVNSHGEPMLDGTQDLIAAAENFRRKSYTILTSQEFERLLSLYYKGYGELPDCDLMEFYKTYTQLSRLNKYSRYLNESDPVQRALDQAVFEGDISQFKSDFTPVAKAA